jgi:hypothetical protein
MEDNDILDDDTVWTLPDNIIDVLWYDPNEWRPAYGSKDDDNKD